jgi:hypothetical protein
MVSATWNAPRETFFNPDSVLYHGKGTDDLFLPITSNYRFIGYEILPDFGVFDIYKNIDIPRAIEEYRQPDAPTVVGSFLEVEGDPRATMTNQNSYHYR